MAERYSYAMALLRRMEPESAHRLAVGSLRLLPRPTAAPPDDPRLSQSLWGRRFANPVGLAAGFDKDAVVADRLARFGFGFVEVGGVTPRPQAGNPRPRLFRLPEDRAVINRMGFNSAGLAAMARRLRHLRPPLLPIGVNLGVNRDSGDRTADFVAGVRTLKGLVDYYAINVSSPNTAGLRDLQEGAALRALLTAVRQARDAHAPGTPLLVKVSPDLSDEDLADAAAAALDCAMDGAVLANTSTLLRDGLRSGLREETGGLSGAPLMARSTEVLRAFRRATGGRLTLIGCGGIGSGPDAYAKVKAGASLVQLYTALLYDGPALVGAIKRDLLALMAKDGAESLAEVVGSDA